MYKPANNTQRSGVKHSDRAALLEIRRIISDPSLSDSECIEAICRIYETLPDMPEAEFRAHRDGPLAPQ